MQFEQWKDNESESGPRAISSGSLLDHMLLDLKAKLGDGFKLSTSERGQNQKEAGLQRRSAQARHCLATTDDGLQIVQHEKKADVSGSKLSGTKQGEDHKQIGMIKGGNEKEKEKRTPPPSSSSASTSSSSSAVPLFLFLLYSCYILWGTLKRLFFGKSIGEKALEGDLTKQF